MEERCVVSAEILMHNSLVDDDLLSLLAVGSVVVELQGLHKLVLVVGVPLVGLDNGHAPLVRLDDVHREILDIVLIVLCNQITLHSYNFFVIYIIFVIFLQVVAS